MESKGFKIYDGGKKEALSKSTILRRKQLVEKRIPGGSFSSEKELLHHLEEAMTSNNTVAYLVSEEELIQRRKDEEQEIEDRIYVQNFREEMDKKLRSLEGAFYLSQERIEPFHFDDEEDLEEETELKVVRSIVFIAEEKLSNPNVQQMGMQFVRRDIIKVEKDKWLGFKEYTDIPISAPLEEMETRSLKDDEWFQYLFNSQPR